MVAKANFAQPFECSFKGSKIAYSGLQRFSKILQLGKMKNDTAHVQYLKDQRGKCKILVHAVLERSEGKMQDLGKPL